jgi:hypothetical protein
VARKVRFIFCEHVAQLIIKLFSSEKISSSNLFLVIKKIICILKNFFNFLFIKYGFKEQEINIWAPSLSPLSCLVSYLSLSPCK